MKNFVIFATDHLGDTLVLSELISNIRTIFAPANICLVVYPQWEYLATLINGVDKVVALDKKGKHKGFWGTFKLKKDIGYKNIFAAIATFKRQHLIFCANFLNPKYVLFSDVNFLFNTFLRRSKYKVIINTNSHISTDVAMLLTGITKEHLVHSRIQLNKDKIKHCNPDFNPAEYIAINPIGEGDYKDIKPESLADIISVFNRENKKILLLGVGEKAKQYIEYLQSKNLEFLSLINKTSIEELVYILSNIKGLISVDTGTAHLGAYLNTSTLWLSRECHWIPDDLYENSDTIVLNSDAETVYQKMINLIQN